MIQNFPVPGINGGQFQLIFKGTTIAPEIESVRIDYFENRADLIVPTLSQDFTEELKNKFTSETNLDLVDDDGDLEFKGYISDYRISDRAPTGNETASLVRLTITVKVDFTNKLESKQSFSRKFSKYSEFDSSKDLSSEEEGLIEEINKLLIEDIFNSAVANW